MTNLKRALDQSESEIETTLTEIGSELGFHLLTNIALRNALLNPHTGKKAAAKSKAIRSEMMKCLKNCGSKTLIKNI